MFTDVVKSTDVRSAFIARAGEHQGNERFRAEILLPHNRVIEDCVREHEGEIVGTAGDSYFVVFRDARRGIECAVAIQRAFIGNPIPIAETSKKLPRRVQARIGMHTGAATQVLVDRKPNYDDHTIAIAHRIEEHAEGEQILVSGDTWKKAGGLEGIRKHEHGGYTLKGVPGKWTLVEVLWDGRKPRRPRPRGGAADRHLLQRYLREVWETSVRLKLTTIDLKAVGSREAAELDLAAVFTDLDVQDASDVEGEALRGRRARDLPRNRRASPHGTGRLPVVAAISRHRKVVIFGDPGAGKSTLMNFLALCLAGEGLGHREVNAKRLGKVWTLPRLLPVRILLRDYAARGLPEKGLWEFFTDELAAVETEDGDLSLCLPEIEAALRRREGAILLLDGIDEVPEANRRRVDLKRAIERFARDFEHCRIVVTSRPYAYTDAEARLNGFDVRTLVDFAPEQIVAFIDRWYAHVGEKDRALGRVNADRYAAQLRRVVETHPRVAELARRPLLLTLMASLHRWSEGGTLPDKRQKLYEESVELLIDLWQREKTRFDQQGRPIDRRQYDVFTELGIRQEKLREALNRLAFVAHRDQPALTGTHDITTEQLAGELFAASDDKGKAGTQGAIDYVTDRAGLLIERVQGKIYTFPHRTFQEYLAACHLAGPDFPHELAERLRGDDQRWREVALLAAAKAASGSVSTIWTLLGAFCPHDWSPSARVEDADWYAALRAAQALVETEQETKAPERQRYLVERLHEWLVELVKHVALPPRDRAEAGLLLNRLPGGDPRVQKDEWVSISGGEFTMGTTDEEIACLVEKYEWAREWQEKKLLTREQPTRVRLDSYRIGKYPVTNDQYRRFIDAGGYAERGKRFWSPEGLEWRRGAKRDEPEYWNDTHWNALNQPVVGVTWHEAQAYCSWLTKHLRSTEEIGRGEVVRLPKESEWEYAARGSGGRTWPWGNEWDPARANTAEGRVGRTTPVGIYPDGASPFGVLDMAGNVWEWCEDRIENDRFRRRRGGGWYFYAASARSAYGNDYTPDYASYFVGFRCVVVPHEALPG
jgi:formylglycine-generating enzyme required for sulfatase activity/class 3 adenylate cyclase